jgi:hypothetical protein
MNLSFAQIAKATKFQILFQEANVTKSVYTCNLSSYSTAYYDMPPVSRVKIFIPLAPIIP